MATLSTFTTLLDFRNRLDPNNRIAKVIELLNRQDDILNDIPWVEANGILGHQTTVRTGLPTPAWKKLNYGVVQTKSRTAHITDSIGHLFQVAEVDKDLAELNGLKAEWMLSEHMPFIEAMNQEFASTLIYGNEGTDPAEFTGLSIRYSDQSAENGDHILTSAATPDNADNTSIWLIGWGENTVHGIYPKGSTAGISEKDWGLIALESQGGTGLRGQAYRNDYSWKCGLSVRDWRYIVRIQFDLENVIPAATSGPDLILLMAQAIRRLPSLGICKPVFYGNRDALDALDGQMNYGGRMQYSNVKDASGQEVEGFRKIPVRRSDAILSTETGI